MLKKMTMITKRQKRWTGRKDELGENLMLHHQMCIRIWTSKELIISGWLRQLNHFPLSSNCKYIHQRVLSNVLSTMANSMDLFNVMHSCHLISKQSHLGQHVGSSVDIMDKTHCHPGNTRGAASLGALLRLEISGIISKM